MNLTELQNIIFEAGIVGAGGAGFPTHKKLSDRVDTLIVNAVECEPLLKVDKYLLSENLMEIALTLELLTLALQAKRGIIAVKSKNLKYLRDIDKIKLKTTKVDIKEVRDIYPAGDEVVLTYEVTGRIIPEASIPLSVGVIVLNAETVLNIHHALQGRSVTHKYVTVAGAVERPVTLCVPVGTPMKKLLEEAGLKDVQPYEVINGGPLMGRICDPANEVVTKTTKGIVVLPCEHSLIQKKKLKSTTALKRATSACCQCRMCSDLCPRYLLGHTMEVHKTVRSVVNDITSDIDPYLKSQLCCACGVCDYVACTQDISPRLIAQEVKGQTLKNNLRYSKGIAPDQVRAEREYRLVPSQRIIDRCGLSSYDVDAKFRSTALEPLEVRIPLRQHIGKAAIPTVEVGDKVEAGQLIGHISMEDMGANIHSSISGEVYEANEKEIVIRRIV